MINIYILKTIVSAEALTTGRMISAVTNSPPAEVPSDNNENVDIYIYAHDAFLE